MNLKFIMEGETFTVFDLDARCDRIDKTWECEWDHIEDSEGKRRDDIDREYAEDKIVHTLLNEASKYGPY